jgi:hypothetical protein
MQIHEISVALNKINLTISLKINSGLKEREERETRADATCSLS